MKFLTKRSILREIFPYLKLKDKNITWYKKIYIYIEVLLMILMILWTLLIVFYNIFFTYKHHYEKLTFYTHENLVNNPKLDTILNTTGRRLEKYNIDLKNLNTNIYLVNNNLLYMSAMLPFSQLFLNHSDAYTSVNSIYFKYVDVIADKVYYNSKKQNSSKFTDILTHELVHVWQKNNLSYINFFFLSTWVKEGYPTYVSEENDTKLKDKKDFLLWVQKNKNKISMSSSYALWGLMIKHAIEKMHKTVDELHEGKVEYDEVLNSLLKEYNITKEEK